MAVVWIYHEQVHGFNETQGVMMKMMQQNIKKQAGLTAFGMIFVIASFGFFVVTSFKVGPMYINFYQIQTIVKAVGQDPAVDLKSRSEIWTAINKRLRINNIRDIGKDAFTITRDRERKVTIVLIKYEVREHYMADVFVGANFEKSIELIR